MQFTALTAILGQPAIRGDHPLASDRWQSPTEHGGAIVYVVWDCNACLNSIQRAFGNMDRLDDEYDFAASIEVRATLAEFLAVSSCIATGHEVVPDSWKLTSACLRHRTVSIET
jgi:hypothetical protein